MDFKIKNKVKLYGDDTVLLNKLLDHLMLAKKMLGSDMGEKMTDEQYHELCHQCYLFKKSGDFHPDISLFSVDDGELHDPGVEAYIDAYSDYVDLDPSDPEYEIYHFEPIQKRKDGLAFSLLLSRIGWDIYCSTLASLDALKKNDD